MQRVDLTLTDWSRLMIYYVGCLLHTWAGTDRMQAHLRKYTQDVEHPINLTKNKE